MNASALPPIDPAPILMGEVQLAEAVTAAPFDLPLAVGAEGMRFIGRRCGAEAEHFGRLLGCRSLPEIAAEHIRYASCAAYDCHDAEGTVITKARDALRPIAALPVAV